MTSKTTALLFLRAACSSDATIAEQRLRCAAYGEARSWRILDAVVDNGIGGSADTPGLKVVRDLIARGEAQDVIATDLARNSRDPDRVHAFTRFCRQHGADLSLTERTVNLDETLHLADSVERADLELLYAAREIRP